MSSRRSRSGGRRSGTRSAGSTGRRGTGVVRDHRARSRFVAATSRTSTRIVRVLPSRSNSRSCSTRSSLGCSSSGMSPTSSRNSVPPWASSKRPIRCAIAPVNAPFSWPNSSLSSRPVGMAAQFSLTNVRLRRGLRSWMARAISSLPGAGLAVDQHRGIGGRDGLHLLQHLPERRALADDLLEVVLRADLVFEVELLLAQLVLQFRDLSNASAFSTAIAICWATWPSSSTSSVVKASGRSLPRFNAPSERSRERIGTLQTDLYP